MWEAILTRADSYFLQHSEPRRTTIFRRITLSVIISLHVCQSSNVTYPSWEGHQGLYRGCSPTETFCRPLRMRQLTRPCKEKNKVLGICLPLNQMLLLWRRVQHAINGTAQFPHNFQGKGHIFSYRKPLNINTSSKSGLYLSHVPKYHLWVTIWHFRERKAVSLQPREPGALSSEIHSFCHSLTSL